MVNWFRKDDAGKFLWPGFGENCRVLAWIFRRCDGEAEAVETPIGLVPSTARSTPRGSTSPRTRWSELLKVDPEEWKAQLPQVHEHFAQFGDDLPASAAPPAPALEERLGYSADPAS